MEQQKYIYVLFSATPYRMGRMIRCVTREPYNHVAIGLEDDLGTFYTFARRYYRTPLYGGFVTELPYRYHHNGITAQVCIYQIPVTGEQYDALSTQLRAMDAQSQNYLYNHLSALAAPIHRKITVPDAYTCAEFAVSVLATLGLDFDTRRFYSLSHIARKLAPYYCYCGSFPVPAEEDPLFFRSRPVSHPLYKSTRDILRLVWRKALI